jgi:serine/threonine protein kinase
MQPIKGVGKGAYGVVCSARVAGRPEKVAIKKIQNAFENETDARRTLREVTLLRQLHHENIIKLVDVMKPNGDTPETFKDVYLVYELMDTDLHQIIRSKQPLSDEHFQYFLYQVRNATAPHFASPHCKSSSHISTVRALVRCKQQYGGTPRLDRRRSLSARRRVQILRGLKYVHSADVLHRDLKPSNLLLNASCDLKICDFGLARTNEAPTNMTEYVVTRWYRAPELLLNAECYTPAIDMWSVGCIIAEMLGRRPAFPGKDYLDQLKLIVRGLGAPSERDMAFIHHEKAKDYIRAKFGAFQACSASPPARCS